MNVVAKGCAFAGRERLRTGGLDPAARIVLDPAPEDVALALLHSGYGTHTLFDAACRVARIRTTVFLESNAPDTMLALVNAGCGLAVLPGTVSLPSNGFTVRKLVQNGKPVEMPVVVHWNPRHFLPPYRTTGSRKKRLATRRAQS